MLSSIFTCLAALYTLGSATPIDENSRAIQAVNTVVQLIQGDCGQCDLSGLTFPQNLTLPPPSQGLHLLHVALGRGTQNYTCDLTNSTAVPAAVGAVATLFNSTCLEVDAKALSDSLPAFSLDLPQPTGSAIKTSDNTYLSYSGQHYFVDTTTAFFDLRTSSHNYGVGAFKKSDSMPAPSNSKIGPNNAGNGAVPWLKLKAAPVPGVTNTIQEVYRLLTAGGSPPKTCAGQQARLQVQYAAQYWFYG